MNTTSNTRNLFNLVLAALLILQTHIFAQGPVNRGPSADVTIDASARQEAIEGALKALNEAYVFPETAKKMEQSIRERMQRKEYDGISSALAFASTLTAHLQEVSRDKHLRVIFNDGSRPMFGGGPDPAERERARMMSAKRNFGFEKVERMSGNIGYLDLRGFEPPDLSTDTAVAAMNFLANTDAMIIDLRQNGGGHPGTVAFISSYLFDKRTHLNDLYDRVSSTTREFWTRDEVPGKRYAEPVFILTSRRTFSAAEEFTYNLKNLKRATVIGETTGGGAHPVNARPLGKHFLITVPFARAINPITKTNWEGAGVKPDIEISADKALKAGHLAALKSVQPKITDPQLAAQLKSMIEELQREVGDITTTLPAQAPPQTSPSASARQEAVSTPSPQPRQSDKEAELPNTPAGKALSDFIKAFNSGDLEAMRRFHRERGGNEENAQQDTGFYSQSGGLRIHSVARSSDFEIEVLAQTKTGERWLSFSIGVEQAAPHAIATIDVRPSSAPGAGNEKPAGESVPSKEKLSGSGLIQHLNALIDKQSADEKFSGVVFIARDGKPIFERAVGLANRADRVPNRVDTKFNLGSINKTFTFIAITQLIESGRLSYDDTIGKHLPDYPNRKAAEKVTVKHLLNMQSGIGDIFGPKFDAIPKNRLRTINDYLQLFAAEPLKFEPGSSREYSNGGYIVLGAIIEKVSGGSYYDYVRDHIFKPSGMENTDSFEADAVVPNLAIGYTRRGDAGDKLVSNLYVKPARGSSAGGGYSTAEDLLRFTIALQNNKLLSAENTKQLVGGGLGIAGGAPGISAALELDTRNGYTIIVLSNLDPPSAERVSEEIRRRM
jgi:CubicO group peptidase (beta-lactamase class C family)